MDGYGFRFLSISPKDLSASKLGDLLKHYEAAIRSEYRLSTGDRPEDAGIVALSSIEDNCTTLRFILSALFVTIAARIGVIPKPNQSFLNNYSPATRTLYRDFYSLSSHYNTPIESFAFSSGRPDDLRRLSIISPEDISRASSAIVESKKTLYGKVITVGGKGPRVGIELSESTALSCIASRELALEAARYLYQDVRVRGEAKVVISLGEPSIKDFTIKEIEQFEPLPPTDLVDILKPHIKDQLNRIDNIEEFFHNLREEEE